MSDLNTVLSTAFGTIKDDILSTMGSALPVALSIVGIGMAVTFGIYFFKKITNNHK